MKHNKREAYVKRVAAALCEFMEKHYDLKRINKTTAEPNLEMSTSVTKTTPVAMILNKCPINTQKYIFASIIEFILMVMLLN